MALERPKHLENKKPKSKSKQFWHSVKFNRSAYLLALPFLLFFFVFTAIPIVSALFLAFTEFKLPSITAFAGIENFKKLFIENDVFKAALKNTLNSLLITGLGGLVFNIILAWFISRFNNALKTLFAVIICLPSFLYGAYAVWGIMLGGEMNAPLNSYLISIGSISKPINWLYTNYALHLAELVKIWSCFSVGFLAILAGFSDRSSDMYDAGKIDGISNQFQEMIFITIPKSAPQITLAAAIQIAAAFSAGSPFTSTAENITLTDYMLMLGTEKYDIGLASALGILISAFSALIYFILRKVLQKIHG